LPGGSLPEVGECPLDCPLTRLGGGSAEPPPSRGRRHAVRLRRRKPIRPICGPLPPVGETGFEPATARPPAGTRRFEVDLIRLIYWAFLSGRSDTIQVRMEHERY